MSFTPTLTLRLSAEESTNARLILDLMAASGVDRLTVEFSGGGDEGAIDNTSGSLAGVACEVPEQLLDMANAFTDNVMCSVYAGFWNDDGGYGQMIFDLIARSVTSELTEYFRSEKSRGVLGINIP